MNFPDDYYNCVGVLEEVLFRSVADKRTDIATKTFSANYKICFGGLDPN